MLFSRNQTFVLDIAVGAPYDGPEGRGAVYIFLGSMDGVLKKPAQVLNILIIRFAWFDAQIL